MTTLRIPPGFARGESKAAVPGRYSHGNLIRWHEGNLKPVNGWDRITKMPLASTPRAGFSWLDTQFQHHTAVICDGHVYKDDGNGLISITPPDWKNSEVVQSARGFGSGQFGVANFGSDSEDRGGQAGNPGSNNYRERTAFPVSYSMDKWGDGELIFASSADGRVWVKKNDASAPFVCPNSPTLIQSLVVTDERHLMTGGGSGFPNRIEWSDQGNREGWNYTNVDGEAGYFDLQDAGQIYTMQKIPGAILIFTQSSVWVGRYIGYPNMYGFTKLASDVSPVSPQAVTVGSNRAFWMTARGFYKYEGGVVSPVPCTLGLDPTEEIDMFMAPKRVCCGFNSLYPEIWWFYPTRGQNGVPENDRYVIYNFVDNWWADGYLQRSFYSSSPIDGFPIAGGRDGHIFAHERGYLGGATTRVNEAWAQIDTLSFEDGDRVYTVNQCQVDTGGEPTNARFEFDCRMARGGPNLPTLYFQPRPDGYMDCRFSARDFTMRVVGTIDGPWAVGALNFDVKARGKR